MKGVEKIFLVGFSGSGKSSVGKGLAKALRARFFDTDQMVVRKAGSSIAEIFARRGERVFRRLEREAITRVVSRKNTPAVIAVGGGAFQIRENRELIRSAGTVVYLSCSQVQIYRRLRHMNNRPLLHSSKSEGRVLGRVVRNRIKTLLNQRRHNYKLADITISTTDRTVRQTVRELVRKIGEINVFN